MNYRVIPDFDFDLLEGLGYEQSIMEGGWRSESGATVIYDMRRPYIGRVMMFPGYPEEEFHKDLNSLQEKGYLLDPVTNLSINIVKESVWFISFSDNIASEQDTLFRWLRERTEAQLTIITENLDLVRRKSPVEAIEVFSKLVEEKK